MVTKYWYIIIPCFMEAVTFIVLWLLNKTVYRKLYSEVDASYDNLRFPIPEEVNQPAHMNKQGGPQGKFWWVRVIEQLIILYHFPIIIPTSLIRKDETTPSFVLYIVTPVAYGMILFGLFH
jgi:hypothetical protein